MKSEQQTDLLRLLDRHFQNKEKLTSLKIASEIGWDLVQTVGILKSLEAAQKIRCRPFTIDNYRLTPEAEEILETGSPEFRLARLLPLTIAEVKAQPGGERALANCLKNRWAEKSGDTIKLIGQECPTVDKVREDLQRLKEQSAQGGAPPKGGAPPQGGAPPSTNALSAQDVANLTRRKLVVKETMTVFEVEPTELFSTEMAVELTDLTKQHLISGEWQKATFKTYNFNACGIPPAAGSIHPLMKFRSLFRQILQQMGFAEMNTRRWVESSLWNFDACYQPQTHPCRDAQDTFFVKDRKSASLAEQIRNRDPSLFAEKLGVQNATLASDLLSQEVIDGLRQVHEIGDDESLGWRYDWEESEAMTLVLRTHTTAITTRMLRYLAMRAPQGPDGKITAWPYKNFKLFSIDRVFRNETLDATHLAEFHQIEGIGCSETNSLAELMGTIKTFFEKLGIYELKFKPTFNPYTEPSMEVYGWHPTLKKWTEIGNSGIFRPELLVALGVPKDIVIYGFGLSLERPAMITYNVKDIRELFGPKAKLSIF